MKLLITSFILTLAVINTWASSITGVVSNKDQEPIPGATVLIVGTQLGAVTNAKGYFEIKDVKNGRYTLEISSIGFKKNNRK